jgi:hypothetical protein
MNRQQLEGRITISRPSSSDSRPPFVRIGIKDQSSRVQFLEVEVDMAEFSLALTGLSEQPCVLKTRQLDKVGKQKEVERVTFTLSQEYLTKYNLAQYDRDRLQAHLHTDPEGRFQKEGWELSTYLGSQGSVTPNHPDGIRINTNRTRYIERSDQ